MSAALGLARTQTRAIGLTLGALYAFHALRGLITHTQIHPDLSLGQQLVSAAVWVPGVCAFIAYVANRSNVGQQLLTLAAVIYPFAVGLWPLVAHPGPHGRLDFWIHQIPGLAAVAALVTLPLWYAWLSLFINVFVVELVMRQIGVVQDWNDALVRTMFSLAYSGFFFIIVLSMLHTMSGTNRVLRRSAREQTEAAIMQARDQEIVRLDRLTHDFVLSLLSSAAEGVPSDKLRVQAETARRQLTESFPEGEDDASLDDVVNRIARRAAGYGIEVGSDGTGDARASASGLTLPRVAATELEAAVEEAVRNTVRHGQGERRLVMTVDDTGFTARVTDEGPGFDPTGIRERLGVSQSILHRMNSLPGGHAAIDSAPGRGSVVTIHWSPA